MLRESPRYMFADYLRGVIGTRIQRVDDFVAAWRVAESHREVA